MRTVLLMGLAAVLAAGCSAGDDGDGGPAPRPSVVSPSASAAPVGEPNGVQEMSPRKILEEAGNAGLRAGSVRIVGNSPAASLDLVVTEDSSDGTRSAGETTLQTRVVDRTIYVQADEAYWTQAFSAKTARRIGDKWVAGSVRNPQVESFRQTSTLRPLLGQFLAYEGEAQVGEVGAVAGQPAVPLTGANGTLWVATTGEPYVLLITSPPASMEQATVEFSDWGEKVDVTAPPRNRTISLADLA